MANTLEAGSAETTQGVRRFPRGAPAESRQQGTAWKARSEKGDGGQMSRMSPVLLGTVSLHVNLHSAFALRAGWRIEPGSQGGSVGKEFACSAGDAGDAGLIPGLGKSPGGGHGNPLQYSCLKNTKNRGAWQATAQKSPKQLDATQHAPKIRKLVLLLTASDLSK